MKKPKMKTMKYLDYNECSKYIAHKLGLPDLRDTLGKFKKESTENVEYRDFWHFLCEREDVHNGALIYIPEPDPLCEYAKPWQNEICQAFHDEFGPYATYWVEW